MGLDALRRRLGNCHSRGDLQALLARRPTLAFHWALPNHGVVSRDRHWPNYPDPACRRPHLARYRGSTLFGRGVRLHIRATQSLSRYPGSSRAMAFPGVGRKHQSLSHALSLRVARVSRVQR